MSQDAGKFLLASPLTAVALNSYIVLLQERDPLLLLLQASTPVSYMKCKPLLLFSLINLLVTK